MLVSEESVAVLEAEVAEALGILEGLPAENNGADQDEIAAVIRRYAEQVERIGSAAGEAGFSGLRDICLLFQENLTALNVRGQGLSDTERERLEEWPILVIGYLMSPDDSQASDALLDHLQNPVWSAPLPATEAHVLRDLLIPAELGSSQEESGETLKTPAEPTKPVNVIMEETVAALLQAATGGTSSRPISANLLEIWFRLNGFSRKPDAPARFALVISGTLTSLVQNRIFSFSALG